LVLVRKKKKLVICEGPNDVKFLNFLAVLYKNDISLIEICHFNELTSLDSKRKKEELKKIIELVSKISTDITVKLIKDPDFKMKYKDKVQENVEFYYWEVPHIESYLFIHHCLEEKRKGIDNPLLPFRYEDIKEVFCSKYFECAKTQNQKFLQYVSKWNEAVIAIDKNDPQIEDFITLAQVLHGHTWVEKMQKTTTDEMINTIKSDPNTQNNWTENFKTFKLEQTLNSLFDQQSRILIEV